MAFRKVFAGRQFSLFYTGTNLPVPLHAHSEYVVGYYLSGRSRCLFRSSESLEFLPGTVGLLNPGDAHQDLESSQERQYLNVNLKKEFFQGLAEDLSCSPQMAPFFPVPKLECDSPLKRIFEALRDESDSQRIGREIVMASLVTELGIWFLRWLHGPGLAFEKLEPRRPLAAWRVRKAVEYLSEHYTEGFDLGRIAESSGLSKYHLDRVFKQSIGMSPCRYVTILRLDKAKNLLTDLSKPIVEIALELGFTDQSHFTNVFKRFTGVTPKTYRLSAAQ
jgi:AraC family transcriptional regulator